MNNYEGRAIEVHTISGTQKVAPRVHYSINMHGLNKPDQDKKKSVCLSMVIGQTVLSVIFRMYMYNRFLNTLKFEVYGLPVHGYRCFSVLLHFGIATSFAI